MNKVILTGNLTKDPEKRATQQGTSITSFTVAVSRKFKNDSGTYDADYINCVAWRQTADFIAQYFKKGSRIGVVGSLQTRFYDDKNGNKRYVTEVIVDDAEFGGPRSDTVQKETEPVDEWEGFEPVDENQLPF